MADVATPPTKLAAWTIPGQAATLPAPFWDVQIDFETDGHSVARFEISVAGNRVTVDESLVNDLEDPEVVEITYSNPALTPSGQVEYFELLILTGDPYPVRLSPCTQTLEESMERDIAIIRVSRDLEVSRRTASFRSLNQCET
ncbi:MAG: hypothetical protein R3358_05095 [Woeseiaceae bacterium]|nr:hypothetical protein [Woeseiaceae bacterium]